MEHSILDGFVEDVLRETETPAVKDITHKYSEGSAANWVAGQVIREHSELLEFRDKLIERAKIVAPRIYQENPDHYESLSF